MFFGLTQARRALALVLVLGCTNIFAAAKKSKNFEICFINDTAQQINCSNASFKTDIKTRKKRTIRVTEINDFILNPASSSDGRSSTCLVDSRVELLRWTSVPADGSCAPMAFCIPCNGKDNVVVRITSDLSGGLAFGVEYNADIPQILKELTPAEPASAPDLRTAAELDYEQSAVIAAAMADAAMTARRAAVVAELKHDLCGRRWASMVQMLRKKDRREEAMAPINKWGSMATALLASADGDDAMTGDALLAGGIEEEAAVVVESNGDGAAAGAGDESGTAAASVTMLPVRYGYSWLNPYYWLGYR